MARILYIEDNKDIAEVVKIMLTRAGFEAEIADCGKTGLGIIKRNKFDLILIDIMLPDMSGWDLFRKLKDKKSENTKFAFLSAIPVSSDRVQELERSGISDYITKPFKKQDLIRRIKKMLGKD